MNRIFLLILIIACGFSLVVYANKQEDDAKQYCKDMMNKNPGYKCKVSWWGGCGFGWTMDKTFHGKGMDYYACKQTESHKKYDEGTEEHRKKAEADCEKIRKEGKKCMVKWLTCGSGWFCMKRYGGPGKDYLVCVPQNHGGFNDVIVH